MLSFQVNYQYLIHSSNSLCDVFYTQKRCCLGFYLRGQQHICHEDRTSVLQLLGLFKKIDVALVLKDPFSFLIL